MYKLNLASHLEENHSINQSPDLHPAANTISQAFLENLSGDRLLDAVERIVRLIETGIPPAGLAMALQVWYRTLSGNVFSEAIPNAAERVHMSRNFALKGMKIVQQANIVDRVKRPGLTDEYEFKAIEEWQQYTPPPTPEKNNKQASNKQKGGEVDGHLSDAPITEKKGWVYLIYAEEIGLYKIGRSLNPENRIHGIRTQIPLKLKLISKIEVEDMPAQESFWHDRFRNKRHCGEWFKLDTQDVEEFMRLSDIQYPAWSTTIPVEDTNKDVVVINKLIEEEQQQEVNVSTEDTPSIWRINQEGTYYAQIPPIYDAEVGTEIQRQMTEEGLTAQSVVKRAIAFSKVPLLVLEVLAAVGDKLLDACWETESRLVKDENNPKSEEIEVVVSIQLSKDLQTLGIALTSEQMRHCLVQHGEDAILDTVAQLKKTGELINQEDKTSYFLQYLQNAVRGVPIEVKQREVLPPKKKGLSPVANVVPSPVAAASKIPDEVMQRLKDADIHLVPSAAERLWTKYPERFDQAIAYTVQQSEAGKIKLSKEGFFRKSLEEDWSFAKSPKQNEQQKPVPTLSLTPEQHEWYEWACTSGVCDGTQIQDLPTKMGFKAVFIPIKDRRPFDPPCDIVIIDVAMREYPIS